MYPDLSFFDSEKDKQIKCLSEDLIKNFTEGDRNTSSFLKRKTLFPYIYLTKKEDYKVILTIEQQKHLKKSINNSPRPKGRT